MCDFMDYIGSIIFGIFNIVLQNASINILAPILTSKASVGVQLIGSWRQRHFTDLGPLAYFGPVVPQRLLYTAVFPLNTLLQLA